MIKYNYKYILIFQDDAILKNNFVEEINKIINEMPENSEIINIGFHKEAVCSFFIGYELDIDKPKLSKIDVTNNICILNNSINPCSLAYIVTLNGANNLINYFNDTGFIDLTDTNYNNYLISKNIFYGSKQVLVTGNHNFKSDIFTNIENI